MEDSDKTRLKPSSPDGTIWKERYLVEKELARGGFGVVYLARDQQLLSKPVVIKVLLEESDPNPYIQKKFRQEIEALARIDHPGIVGVLDVGDTPEGKPFLVMQFVEGVTLRSLITPGGMPLDQVARIMEQIGLALTAAHEKGVFHRDLKPENIMLQNLGDGEAQVKLIDFGIAAVRDSEVLHTKQTSMVAGTLSYMAPEQVLGKASGASDIYSLGVIGFEMITGERPDNTPEGVARKPREFRPDVPLAAEEAILKALAYLPERRQSRPREYGDQLAAALRGSRTILATVKMPAARPAVARKPAPQTAASGTRKALLLGAAAVVAATAIGGGYFYSRLGETSAVPAASTPAVPAKTEQPNPPPAPAPGVAPSETPVAEQNATPPAVTPATPAPSTISTVPIAAPDPPVPQAQQPVTSAPPRANPQPFPPRGDGPRARGPLQEVRQRFVRLQSRFAAVSKGIQELPQQPNRRGGGVVRRGMVTERERIQQLMADASAAINSGDAQAARQNLFQAEQRMAALEELLKKQ